MTGRGLPGGNFLGDADRAERAGDSIGASLALRRHLERNPDDSGARLRFARLLIASGEHAAARQALAPLSAGPDGGLVGLSREVTRTLAELDEAEGALSSAAARWERLLADDIDDAQARAHLTRLRPRRDAWSGPADERRGATETLVSPEGVETLRYRLVREIGRGATATVYLARDEALDLAVALKVLHPQLGGARQAEALVRFFAGARLAAGLRHPGVVAVYDIDEATRTLAMEWIGGGTLRSRLRESPGGLAPAEIAATARALLGTLAFLHARGIVHGDLKPSNLLLRAPGDPVLADFGAAELYGARESTAGGTPLYLAPEQFRGAPSSPATDLYAAGAVLFEMTAGRPLRSHTDLLRGNFAEPLSPEAHAQIDARAPELHALIGTLLSADPPARTPA